MTYRGEVVTYKGTPLDDLDRSSEQLRDAFKAVADRILHPVRSVELE